ncbi:MAG TPA: ABC transporter permease [Bacteroidia bacterium]|jgi:lipopolysaccharide transport system permease protein|nr:ABC transporter permease [Bacteroidia bacterium]
MEYEIKPQEKISLGLKELWQYRELFFFFTWRDIKVKYKQTVFGFAWAVFQPLLMMAIFTVFFGGSSQEGLPYEVFSLSGLILWNVFSTGLSNAGNSMVTNANIIKKIYFPRLIIPISAVLVSLFDFVMAFIIFIPFLIYYHIHVSLLFPVMLIVGLLITAVSTFGVGSLLAALNIKYRDFRYVIPFMVQAMLFLTPVIKTPPDRWKYILAVNPMYSAIELFRSGFNDKPLEYNLLAISITSAILFFVIGLYYFRRTESYFADLA